MNATGSQPPAAGAQIIALGQKRRPARDAGPANQQQQDEPLDAA